MKYLLSAIALCAAASVVRADPPTDPKARKIYDHDKEWLSHFPSSFVATNIRGEGMSYPERRMAALDLVRQQRDFGVVSELMDELNKKSFLSPQICDILGEWKARRALPLLKLIAADSTREKDVRDHAKKAADAIEGAASDHPPTFNEQGVMSSTTTTK
jgi:hypothetical protein